VPSPSSGYLIAGTNQSITFSFSSDTCITTFYETNLPSGYTWSVSYDGNSGSASTGSSITLTTGSGTYTAKASVSGLTCIASASVKAGSSYTFSSWNCTTTFTEKGLPSGDRWSVTYDNKEKSSTSSSITFNTNLGSFSWSASASNHSVNSACVDHYNTPSGTSTAGSSISVSFSSSTNCYTTFYETNLPSGYTWSVSYDGNSGSASTGSSITLDTGPGNYTAKASVSGLSCTASSASVNAGNTYTFSSWSCVTYFYIWTQSPLPSSNYDETVTFNGTSNTQNWGKDSRVILPNGKKGLEFDFSTPSSTSTESWSVDSSIPGEFGDCGTLTGYDLWTANVSSGNVYPGQSTYIYYTVSCPI